MSLGQVTCALPQCPQNLCGMAMLIESVLKGGSPGWAGEGGVGRFQDTQLGSQVPGDWGGGTTVVQDKLLLFQNLV